jgi:hypothetical protein
MAYCPATLETIFQSESEAEPTAQHSRVKHCLNTSHGDYFRASDAGAHATRHGALSASLLVQNEILEYYAIRTRKLQQDLKIFACHTREDVNK